VQAHLPEADAAAVRAAETDWRAAGATARLWRRDAGLWTGADEASWLGWLDGPARERTEIAARRALAEGARRDGVRHVLLLGMGGSSLCCEVLARTFGAAPGAPELVVVDSTVPGQVLAAEARVELDRALVVVSSKSGSTLETDVLSRHFFERLRARLGPGGAAARFVAITDPGSSLEQRARGEGWRAVVAGVPDVGGRFSALSPFGTAPAALLGVDLDELLAGAERMARACGPDAPPERNPGVTLGLALAALAQRGRDKLTLVASPGLASLGAWLEQLVAESLGKAGRGIVPVDGEPLASPERYGDDRLFVYVRLVSAPAREQDAAVDALARAGRPVLRIDVERPAELGAEFFRWEIATAVAGARLGVNPFDQPDVEAAKVAARRLTARYEETGELPASAPLVREGALEAHADPRNAAALDATTLRRLVASHLARLRPHDYFAVNAFVERSDAAERELAGLRRAVRDAHGAATAIGFGPRFLHSTGQLHKGGPNSGVFLEITAEDAADLEVPGRKIRFGALKDAQALGDFEVLCERHRRALRLHVADGDAVAGLARVRQLVESVLA
jgi:transaldolase/glucose-6-phosphate isomerase